VSIDPVIAVILRALLTLLFAAAVWHKLSDWTAFRIVLHDYEVLPGAAVTPAAVAVVTLESLLVAAFPWAAWSSTAAVAAIALLAVYSAAIGINLARGRRTLDCGCAPSTYRQPLTEALLVRNAVLAVAAGVLSLPTTNRGIGLIDGLTAAGATASIALLWTSTQILTATWPSRSVAP
jgi:hypothetical protein